MPLKRLILQAALVLLTTACSLSMPLSMVATPTPTITLTPSPLPTATATPTPTPTPTPVPAARVASGDQALINGDYDTALSQYQSALTGSSDPEVKAAAQLGIGRVDYLTGDYSSALEALRIVTDQYPNSTHRAAAYFYLGKTYDALKRSSEAASAYAMYLQLHPGVLDSYVEELRGDALVASEEYTGAIGVYQTAMDAPHLGSNESLEIKIARAYAASGDNQTALLKYQQIFAATSSDYTRAEMDLLMGQSLINLGDTEEAYQRFQDAVTNYPRSYDSYSALVGLVNAGVPVDELNRGLVDYFAGQYGPALDAFNRYEASTPTHDATVNYYKAMTQLQLGQTAGAVTELDTIIADFKADRFWNTAWSEKAYIQWAYLDQYDAAAQTLLDFVAQMPQDADAPANLFEAARIMERNQELDKAAQTWERLADEYPSSDQTQSALILAGVARYREKNYSDALRTFQRALLLATTPADQSAALLWVGKSQQAENDPAAAKQSWQRGMETDPTGYYSERARDLLLGQAPFSTLQNIDLGYDLAAEKPAAESWMRTQFNLPADTNLDGLGSLADDPRLQRGQELWNLGEYSDARLEFEDLRQSVSSDPAATFRLAGYFVNLGVYRSAILAARQVLTLAGMDDAATLSAPIYFNHIRFGIYYKDLVFPEAEADGFDPLFIFSVIRQESLFEGFVQSSAGALGLMQIIPSTGQSIAANLAWPANYTTNDLYRPLVSIRLGIRYMSQQRNYFDGDLYAALAAYNSGPGNAGIWNDLAGGDPDVFLETVRIQQTRDYIMSIYEIYKIYQRLYFRSF